MKNQNLVIDFGMMIGLTMIILIISGMLINTLTGYDIKVREKCIDRNYAEFENEYCIRDYHCGIISQQFDSKCSGGRR